MSKDSRRRKIKVQIGRTVNLGNFESARIDVGVEEQSRLGEDVAPRYKILEDWCCDRVNKFVADVEAALGGKKKKKRSK